MDGSGPVEDVVSGIGQPYYLYVDLIDSRLYWADLQNTYIRRMSLDGQGIVEDFITGLTYVRDIALDTKGGKIYWGDRGASTIQSMRLDGSEVITTLYGPWDGLDRPHGLALDVDAGKIYWTDTRTMAVHRGDMDGTGPLESIATGLDGPWSIGMILPQPDSDFDGLIDFSEFARFAQNWLDADCSFCHGADYNTDNNVTSSDLQIFADQWLASP
jgi:low density lipoprotein receptor-related protein 5/6